MKRTKPRLRASATDPRCIDYRSGRLWDGVYNAHYDRTGETLPTIAKKIGISVEALRAYPRGHMVPSQQTREKLEDYFGLERGAGIPKPYREADEAAAVETTHVVHKGFLVITTRIPLSQIAA